MTEETCEKEKQWPSNILTVVDVDLNDRFPEIGHILHVYQTSSAK
jgi:hypothetical protein